MRKTKENNYFSIFDTDYRKSSVHNLSHWWSVFCVGLVFALSWYSKHRLLSLPRGLTVNDLPTHPNAFIAERAWHDLNILTSFGPRPTGVHANEVLAIDFLKRELSYIQKNAHPNQKIYADIQKVSGSYFAQFKPHPMTNVYRNVQNFIVQLAGSEQDPLRKNHTLMLNCHFDSVAGSPGASDDAASCTVMLEVLRVLSQEEKRLRHSVLFLFNGAEETPLQASHGFITQHPWAENVRAFLNLESVGSNGKEILFQAGPNHAWLIDMYKNAAPYPNGQVTAEELFQSGLIPSDTDFRIFRDFGHVPGMDFAHVMHGYRYHTKYDHIDYIPPEALQRTGTNVLELVRIIANSDELANTKAYETGRMVYFDYIGFFFIAYTEGTGQLLNILVAVASVVVSYYLLQAKGIKPRYIRKEIFYGLAATVAALFLGNIACYLIATELDFTGESMSWYYRTFFSICLFCFPSAAVHAAFYAHLTRQRDSPLSLGLKAQARLIGVNLFWAVLSIGLTLIGYRTAYVFMIPNLIVLITNVAIAVLKAQNTHKKWLYVHLIGQAFIILWTSHLYHLVIDVFIPLTGRNGGSSNPDVIIGVISCFFTLFMTSSLIPLVGLLNRPRILLVALVSVYILTRATFVVTHLDFPYNDDPKNPTPQRQFVTHTIRRVYDQNGRPSYSDAGYWFRKLDRNTEKTIDSLTAPETPIPQEEMPLSNELPFGGVPAYTCRQVHTSGFWLNAPAPLIRDEAHLKLEKKIKLSEVTQQLQFSINGSYLYSLQIRPKPGVTLSKWNLLDYVPEMNNVNGHKGYFVMVTHGLEAPPFNVTMEFNAEQPNYDGPLVDITLVTFQWEFQAIPAFAELLARMPKWAFTVPSVASLHAWKF